MSQEASSETATSAEVRDATSPFNGNDADFILRSSDRVDFHVHKLILALASPTFKSMFTLPSPTPPTTTHAGSSGDDDQRDGLPIAQLSEDAATLDILLRACYPCSVPDILDLGSLQRVLDAAEKCEIEAYRRPASVLLKSFVNAAPIQVYSLACRFGFADIVPIAGKAALSVNFNELLNVPPPTLRILDSLYLHRLLRYHRQCGDVARQVSGSTHWRRWSTGARAKSSSRDGKLLRRLPKKVEVGGASRIGV